MGERMRVVALVAALGSGLVAGALFAFSAFVMAGLRRLAPPAGMAAMQSINVTAVRPPLMTAMFGTAAACVGVAVWAITQWGSRASWLALIGALVYLVGVIGVTAAANVPRNDRLAATAVDASDAARVWDRYLVEWTAWNHVRVVSGAVAVVLLVLAMTASGRRA